MNRSIHSLMTGILVGSLILSPMQYLMAEQVKSKASDSGSMMRVNNARQNATHESRHECDDMAMHKSNGDKSRPATNSHKHHKCKSGACKCENSCNSCYAAHINLALVVEPFEAMTAMPLTITPIRISSLDIQLPVEIHPPIHSL